LQYATKPASPIEVLLNVSLTDAEITDYRCRFETLTPAERNLAVVVAHGFTCYTGSERLGISVPKFFRTIKFVLAKLDCSRDELPKIVFAALGLLIEHSM